MKLYFQFNIGIFHLAMFVCQRVLVSADQNCLNVWERRERQFFAIYKVLPCFDSKTTGAYTDPTGYCDGFPSMTVYISFAIP